MNAFPSKSLSDNRKPVVSNVEPSAIQNPKWLGLSVIAFIRRHHQGAHRGSNRSRRRQMHGEVCRVTGRADPDLVRRLDRRVEKTNGEQRHRHLIHCLFSETHPRCGDIAGWANVVS